MDGINVRLAMAGLLGSLALGGVGAPVAQAAGTTACRVRNVTQGTVGRSFKAMVAAALDGDVLTVRGTCVSRGVVIGTDINIRGVGDTRAVLTGDDLARVLRLPVGVVAELRNLKLTRGWAAVGGAVMNRGDLTLVDTIVQRSHGVHGAGIATYGALRLTDSEIRRNGAWDAAGILVAAGTATLTRSRVAANIASVGSGGGIDNEGTLTLVDSVVAHNLVISGGGGGILSRGVVSLIDSTVRANTAMSWDHDSGGGGGIQNAGALALTGSAVVGNAIGGAPGGGGGIYNWSGSGTVTLDVASSVTANTPDDCFGTTAC